MFIRRMDEILGMKVYRPVSRGAKPRLQAKDEKDELQRVTRQKSAYYVNWKATKSNTIKNVLNVKKMR